MSLSLLVPSSSLKIQTDVSLAELTSYRIGGMAQWYVSITSQAELESVFDWYSKQSVPLTFLGAGSNLLVSDEGLPGLVLSTKHLRGHSFNYATGQITASAGEPLARIAWMAAKLGWKGLEWAVGIPGTVGGSVVMNAGAHKHSISDILIGANVADESGIIDSISSEDFQFSYRTSLFQTHPRMVVDATFQLEIGYDPKILMAETTTNLNKRKDSQPYNRPSCGSVFRNPYPQSAGWLIEAMGLKGYQIGEAQVSQRHANFIINQGKAKAADVFRLIMHVQEQVQRHWSIALEPEVKMLGYFPAI